MKETIDHGEYSQLYKRTHYDGEVFHLEVAGWSVIESEFIHDYEDGDRQRKDLAQELGKLIGELERYQKFLDPDGDRETVDALVQAMENADQNAHTGCAPDYRSMVESIIGDRQESP